jgi:hypothetical protein
MVMAFGIPETGISGNRGQSASFVAGELLFRMVAS